MGNLGIFLIGLVVSAMVSGALVLLVYGARMDGRVDSQRDAAESEAQFNAQASAPSAGAVPTSLTVAAKR